jgi:hypothetical protein
MRTDLSSRERMLCAMRGQQPDHVPLWNLWRNLDVPFTYRNQVERAEAVGGLGLDDTMHGSLRQVVRQTEDWPYGGFVLYPVDQMVKETPWENIVAMIGGWKTRASYPVL